MPDGGLRLSVSALPPGGTAAAELKAPRALSDPEMALRCVLTATDGRDAVVATGRVSMLSQTTAGWQMNLSVPDGAPASGGSIRWELVVSEAGAGFKAAFPVIVA
jgi:hypothetical protein